MNIQTKIPDELWNSVKINYERKHYSNAILDSFYLLSDLIREKSGMEGDGSTLIGSALGGQNPKIKLNRLQSESEINFQRGMEQILRGLYQSIRNPRSHEKIEDSEETAQTIIIFIGFIVENISQAKSRFSKEEFLKRVKDKDFVQEERYADLLTSEIPENQLLAVFLEVYKSKREIDLYSLNFFLKSLFKKISQDDKEKIYEIISDDLKTTNEDIDIRCIIGTLGTEVWPNIDQAARLRIENKLIKSIRDGIYHKITDNCSAGSLGTWSINIFPHFTLKNEISYAILKKLNSNIKEEIDYLFKFIFHKTDNLFKSTPKYVTIALIKLIESGNKIIYEELERFLLFNEIPELAEPMKNFKEKKIIYKNISKHDLDDDIPF